MQRDGVTIVLGCRNQEPLVPRALTSALKAIAALRNQGITGEVLVIDDGSRDGSAVLLRQLEALHYGDGLRVRLLEKPAGLAASRNAAFDWARFRSVLFMGADEELLPTNVPHFYRALREADGAAAYGNVLFRGVGSRCAYFIVGNETIQETIFHRHHFEPVARLGIEHFGCLALFDGVRLRDQGGFTDDDPGEIWPHLASVGERLVFVPMAFGYRYALPSACSKAEATARLRDIYDPAQARGNLPLKTARLRYHPAIGIL